MNKIPIILQQYFTQKIGAEIKCCLTFFYMVCFYWVYKWANGFTEASIVQMAAMLWTGYIMEWIQQLIGCDFFETDSLGKKELAVIFIGSSVYSLLGHLLKWFDGNIAVDLGFFGYMALAYFCTFAVCKVKRIIDGKALNSDLRKFKEREKTL